MPKLIVEVAADISQYLKSLKAGEHAAETFAKEVTVDSRAVAEAQVKAAIKSTEALEKEAAAYRAVAATAEKGSKEQVAAARLAANAEEKLAREIGRVDHAAAKAHTSTSRFSRDVDHAARGALSGSHAVHGLGRSLAFASGGFIAFHSATEFLRESVDAAREAVVAHRSLAAQMKASGESFEENRERIEKASLAYGKFGFENDEVVASLTVLERGTGNINKALRLQMLTADLARAKNLDLSNAATVVAKVFGGQETALRRAVPGLSRHAHGMDLIRLAEAKLAGQAAANTTAAERFHAVLHDTQEIVGGALLPTLNQYLDRLSAWLEEMNRSGKLEKDVQQTTKFLADAIAAAKAVLEPFVVAFKALADILGGNKRALEVLFGAFLAFKGLKIAQSVYDTAAGFFKLGKNAEGATGKVAKLRGALLRLVANPYTLAIVLTFIGAEYVAKKIKQFQQEMLEAQNATFKKGEGVETTLVPNLAKQIETLKQQGVSSMEIIKRLRERLGGSLKADDLIAEAFQFSSGADPKMQARIREQVAKRAGEAVDTAKDELDKQVKKVPIETRNTWFDNLISRLLGGVEDTPTGAPAGLQTQLERLRKVAAILTKRIAATKDITRKLKLEAELQDVMNQEWQKQQEINQATVDAAEKAKEDRQKAVDAMLGALEVDVARAGLTKTLSDNITAQRKLIGFLRGQVKETHGSSEAWQALISAQGELNDLEEQAAQQREEAIATRQFRVLGFGPGGEELVPGIKNLKKQADAVRDAIKGSFLDTRKTRGMLANIEQVLSGHLGKVGKDVRAKIREILDGIRNDLKSQEGFATRYSPASPKAIMAALGFNLTDAQQRQMRAVLAQLGPGGLVAPHQSRAFALAGGGGVTIHGDVHVHGVQDVGAFENQLAKRHNARAHIRRGAR